MTAVSHAALHRSDRILGKWATATASLFLLATFAQSNWAWRWIFMHLLWLTPERWVWNSIAVVAALLAIATAVLIWKCQPRSSRPTRITLCILTALGLAVAAGAVDVFWSRAAITSWNATQADYGSEAYHRVMAQIDTAHGFGDAAVILAAVALVFVLVGTKTIPRRATEALSHPRQTLKEAAMNPTHLAGQIFTWLGLCLSLISVIWGFVEYGYCGSVFLPDDTTSSWRFQECYTGMHGSTIAVWFFLVLGLVLLLVGLILWVLSHRSPAVATPSAQPSPATSDTDGDASLERRLHRLSALHRSQAITDAEYAAKRAEFLDEL